MVRSKSMRCIAAGLAVGLLLSIAARPVNAAKDAAPQVSEDGLHLVKQTKTRLIYERPDATFTQFKRVAILECTIQFSKDWLRDYNRSQSDPLRRIGDKDLERAFQRNSRKFSLTSSRGRGLSNLRKRGPGCTCLATGAGQYTDQRTGPDDHRAQHHLRTSGATTLYLELWDFSTNTILARVMDARASNDSFAQRSNSITNMAAANSMMRAWDRELRERLDIVTGKNETS